MAGAFFETFVVAEVLKSYFNSGIIDPPLYFYRDRNRQEIDLLIWQNGMLHPVEIKKHADPSLKDIKAFPVIDALPNIRRGPGGVVCLYDRPVPLGAQDMVIPLGFV